MKSCHSQGSSRGFVGVSASALHLYVHTENQQHSISRSCPNVSERGIQIPIQECAAFWKIQNSEMRRLKRCREKRLLASSRLSVRLQHRDSQLDGFPCNLILWASMKICREIPNFVKIGQRNIVPFTSRPKHALLLSAANSAQMNFSATVA
jgi:hypothetical protein